VPDGSRARAGSRRSQSDASSRLVIAAVISAAVGGAAWAGVEVGSRSAPPDDALAVGSLVRGIARRAADGVASVAASRELARPMQLPTGAPPSLTCAEARHIVSQVERTLAEPPPAVDPVELAQAIGDWLDPHGMWSAGPGAAPRSVILSEGPHLLDELRRAGGRCVAAETIGRELASWMPELRGEMERGMESAPSPLAPTDAIFRAAAATPFEDGPVARPARDLAQRIGLALGTVRGGYGVATSRYVGAAVDRFAPDLPPSRWSEVVLAASVRAFVPLVDPHGAWSPADETTSIYDVGLEGNPPAALWEEMTRTALGIRIDRGARSPLLVGDLVLAIDDVETAGLSVEQSNQLALVPRAHGVRVVILREGELAPRELAVEEPPPRPPDALAGGTGGLRTRRTGFGDGEILVVTVPDVPDDLGDRIEETLEDARNGALGVLLDLRGNGGGSTDGALDALAPFLPGAPLFPMRRRDGSLEVDRAPMPLGPRWDGPVAVLVDEETASAAEMITAAIASYGRGVVLGRTTYGKGCAQEYLDDDAGAGLLRLTTLVFARPDGEPMQRTGVVPDVTLPLLAPPSPRTPSTGAAGPPEREASIPHAMSAWRGPDVRSGDYPEPEWPSHGGHVGPCVDPEICRALLSLGTPPRAAR
jgi:carboxyl-terminal processing protease